MTTLTISTHEIAAARAVVSVATPTETDLAPVHSLQQLPDFTAIAQYSNLPPIKVRMRLTFRDRDLKRLLSVPAPAVASSPQEPLPAGDGRSRSCLNT